MVRRALSATRVNATSQLPIVHQTLFLSLFHYKLICTLHADDFGMFTQPYFNMPHDSYRLTNTDDSCVLIIIVQYELKISDHSSLSYIVLSGPLWYSDQFYMGTIRFNNNTRVRLKSGSVHIRRALNKTVSCTNSSVRTSIFYEFFISLVPNPKRTRPYQNPTQKYVLLNQFHFDFIQSGLLYLSL